MTKTKTWKKKIISFMYMYILQISKVHIYIYIYMDIYVGRERDMTPAACVAGMALRHRQPSPILGLILG